MIYTIKSLQNGGQATRADSLALLRNTLAYRNYVDNVRKGMYIKEPSGVTTAGIFDALDSFLAYYETAYNDKKDRQFMKHVKNGKLTTPINPNEYRIRVNKNQFYQRDNASNVIDLDAPTHLYDRRIIPYSKVILKYPEREIGNPLNNDRINYAEYHPLQVTPFDMLTPEQQVERQKMFGRNPGEPLATLVPKKTFKKTEKYIPKKASTATSSTLSPTERTPEEISRIISKGMPSYDKIIPKFLKMPDRIELDPTRHAAYSGMKVTHYTDELGRETAKINMVTNPGVEGRLGTFYKEGGILKAQKGETLLKGKVEPGVIVEKSLTLPAGFTNLTATRDNTDPKKAFKNIQLPVKKERFVGEIKTADPSIKFGTPINPEKYWSQTEIWKRNLNSIPRNLRLVTDKILLPSAALAAFRSTMLIPNLLGSAYLGNQLSKAPNPYGEGALTAASWVKNSEPLKRVGGFNDLKTSYNEFKAGNLKNAGINLLTGIGGVYNSKWTQTPYDDVIDVALEGLNKADDIKTVHDNLLYKKGGILKAQTGTVLDSKQDLFAGLNNLVGKPSYKVPDHLNASGMNCIGSVCQAINSIDPKFPIIPGNSTFWDKAQRGQIPVKVYSDKPEDLKRTLKHIQKGDIIGHDSNPGKNKYFPEHAQVVYDVIRDAQGNPTDVVLLDGFGQTYHLKQYSFAELLEGGPYGNLFLGRPTNINGVEQTIPSYYPTREIPENLESTITKTWYGLDPEKTKNLSEYQLDVIKNLTSIGADVKKDFIMKTGISNERYDELIKLLVGIAGQESNYGVTTNPTEGQDIFKYGVKSKFRTNFEQFKDAAANILRREGPSRGPLQVKDKFMFKNPATSEALKEFNIEKDNYDPNNLRDNTLMALTLLDHLDLNQLPSFDSPKSYPVKVFKGWQDNWIARQARSNWKSVMKTESNNPELSYGEKMLYLYNRPGTVARGNAKGNNKYVKNVIEKSNVVYPQKAGVIELPVLDLENSADKIGPELFQYKKGGKIKLGNFTFNLFKIRED